MVNSITSDLKLGASSIEHNENAKMAFYCVGRLCHLNNLPVYFAGILLLVLTSICRFSFSQLFH